MPNEWLGYSERGLMAAWFHDLCGLGNRAVGEVAAMLFRAGLTDPALIAAIGRADELLAILEPSFSQFGDPDGILVFRRADRPLAWLQVEAKRGPLVTEWTAKVGAAGGGKWKSSQLVVQVARRMAFRGATTTSRARVSFTASNDYWRGARGRVMELQKASICEWIDDLHLNRTTPSAVVTLTSSCWDAAATMLTAGDSALTAILRPWGIQRPRPQVLHLGLDDLVPQRGLFPTLQATFRFNLLDTVSQATDLEPDAWDRWEGRCNAAAVQGLHAHLSGTLVHEHGGRYGLYVDGRNGPAAVKLMPCYGPGGPVLDLRHRPDPGSPAMAIPPGWKSWSAVWGVPHRAIPVDEGWFSQRVVPA